MTTAKQPIVTVCVIPRESFNEFADVVQRIYDTTSPIFKMIIMDGGAPKNRIEQLKAIQAKHPDTCRIVHSERWKQPYEMVNEAIPMIDTKYVCFIDNDVEVLEGWLEGLVECAETYRAGCVHPIYLTVKLSDPKRTIHIAEGQFYKEKRGDKWFIDTVASYSGVPLEKYPYKAPRESDFFEWHTVLFSKELLDKVGPLDELTIAEHMDYALRIHEAGGKIMIQPKSVVAYDYARIWRLRGADRRYMLWRWDLGRVRKSHEILHRKWNLVPESTARREHFAVEHAAKVRSMNIVNRALNKFRRMIRLGNRPVKVGPKPKTASEAYQEKHLKEVSAG